MTWKDFFSKLFLRIAAVILIVLAFKCNGQSIEGFGSGVTGGQGFPIMHVTNLNTSGPGSLSNLIGSNRIIVFDVTGSIDGFSKTINLCQNLTIDGSGLPAPGITLNGNNNGDVLSFDGSMVSNIIVKNIRVRNGGNDGINIINGAHDIALDHITSRENRDGNIDITSGSYNVTIQYCLNGPGNSSAFSGGMLIAYTPTRNISIHHNLFYTITSGQVGERNPFIHSSNQQPGANLMADFRNNVVYKWGRNNGTGSGYGSAVAYTGTANIVKNYYYSIVSQNNATNVDDGYGNGATGKAFISGNFSGNGIDANAPNNHGEFLIPSAANVQMQDPCTAAYIVKGNAGCRPLDQVDQNILNQINLVLCPVITPIMWLAVSFDIPRRLLKWSMAQEENSVYFDVQESENGIDFYSMAKIGTIATDGNSISITDYQLKL